MLAIAFKESGGKSVYSKEDESDLVLRGYIAFLDPPKETARPAIDALQKHGVAVKVLTGDNDLVSRKVCSEVGIPTDTTLLGVQVEQMDDAELAEKVDQTTLFARLSPAHKQRIVKALQAKGHVVGFMGDGINDAPGLRAADVGISVDSAVDIAKESADVILLEKSLLVLEEGILEGRNVFANILKYIRMGASSSFGNMFSVLGASAFLPFEPMIASQILMNNLLYDFSQVAIPTDDVDPEQVAKPHPWSMGDITRFILLIGPCSSIFDYVTFFVMMYFYNCWQWGGGGGGPPRGRRATAPLGTERASGLRVVPNRLVHRIAAHPDADYPRHPYQQDSLFAEPSKLAIDRYQRDHHGHRDMVAVLARGQGAEFRAGAGNILADCRGDFVLLHRADADRKNVAD